MEKRLDDLLKLMRAVTERTEISLGEFQDTDWEYIFQKSMRSSFEILLFERLRLSQKSQDDFPIPEELWEKWKTHSRNCEIQEVQKRYEIQQLLHSCKAQGVNPVVFKGYVLAELYEEDLARRSSDVDLLFPIEQRPAVEQLFTEKGYFLVEEKSKENVPVYFLPQVGLTVEAHYCLWEDYEGKQMELLESLELAKEESLIQVSCCGMKMTTLEPTNHLIYQMFHIIKHFYMRGVGFRYLTDLTCFVNAYGQQIDKTAFWKAMKCLSYEQFALYFFSFCVTHLGMHKEILPEGKIVDIPREEAFFKDLVNKGELFEKKSLNWEMLTIMEPYFVGKSQGQVSKGQRLRKMIFPGVKELPDYCAYARKLPVLLPVAWVQKWVLFLVRRIASRNEKMAAGEKIKAAQYRFDLLAGMGLLHTEDEETKS